MEQAGEERSDKQGGKSGQTGMEGGKSGHVRGKEGTWNKPSTVNPTISCGYWLCLDGDANQ